MLKREEILLSEFKKEKNPPPSSASVASMWEYRVQLKKEEEEGQERNVTTVKRFCSRADSAQKGRDAAISKDAIKPSLWEETF